MKTILLIILMYIPLAYSFEPIIIDGVQVKWQKRELKVHAIGPWRFRNAVKEQAGVWVAASSGAFTITYVKTEAEADIIFKYDKKFISNHLGFTGVFTESGVIVKAKCFINGKHAYRYRGPVVKKPKEGKAGMHSYNMNVLILHEMGHCLGLDHSTEYSIMKTPIDINMPKHLTGDDYLGIQSVWSY